MRFLKSASAFTISIYSLFILTFALTAIIGGPTTAMADGSGGQPPPQNAVDTTGTGDSYSQSTSDDSLFTSYELLEYMYLLF
jgi:hypothetical protein